MKLRPPLGITHVQEVLLARVWFEAVQYVVCVSVKVMLHICDLWYLYCSIYSTTHCVHTLVSQCNRAPRRGVVWWHQRYNDRTTAPQRREYFDGTSFSCGWQSIPCIRWSNNFNPHWCIGCVWIPGVYHMAFHWQAFNVDKRPNFLGPACYFTRSLVSHNIGLT